jgi:hypothetical protein
MAFGGASPGPHPLCLHCFHPQQHLKMHMTCLEAPCCSTRPAWPLPVAGRCRVRPVAASLPQHRSSNSQQLSRRLPHRRSGEPAVEPAAAVGSTAVPTASGSGRDALNSSSGSGRLVRASSRLRVAVDVDEGARAVSCCRGQPRQAGGRAPRLTTLPRSARAPARLAVGV